MDVVADLHLHSRYSRAVSPEMNLRMMENFARKKGLEVLGTGDWTHPLWFREIKSQLEETKQGLFQVKNNRIDSGQARMTEGDVYFLLSVEISSIFSQGGKSRRIHNLIFVPSFESAEKISQELLRRGANLSADGRPIIGVSSKNLLELILEIDERNMLIPAHIWTPWFGLFGANSGFDSIKESFEDLSDYIYGIETGLSSDPEMNWAIKELNTRSILSFSDAHSAPKMGREATVLRLSDLSYESIRKAIIAPSQNISVNNEIAASSRQGGTPRNDNRVLYTVEFYPEEGKYHYNGHRNCNVYQTPEESRAMGEICPVCKRRVTVGVMQRVEDLSDEHVKGITQSNQHGLKWIKDPKGKHPPFVKLVPLNEIIAESMNSTVSSLKVKATFDKLCDDLGSEMQILLKTPTEGIEKIAGEKIAEGIEKVRGGNIYIKPGYDNVYGIVKIWDEEKDVSSSTVTPGETSSAGTASVDKEKQLGIDF